MPKTTVGLFKDPAVVEDVIREIEAAGFPRNEVRSLDEPATFPVDGVMSFARLDFEVALIQELTRIGATETESEEYLEGLRRGGALVFATGSDNGKVDIAAEIMNQHGAVEIEETSGPEPHLPNVTHESANPIRDRPVQAGRLRLPGSGACVFVW
jgi:hypothetical protein